MLMMGYSNFSTLIMDFFNYLLTKPEYAIPIIGGLIIYFGYYSTVHTPERTNRLLLYFHGFHFLIGYIGFQLFILYILLEYFSITPSKIFYWLLILLLFSLLTIIIPKIKINPFLRLLTVVLFLLTAIFIQEKILNLLDFKLIAFILIFYHSTAVISSKGTKESLNQNSYDYKEFYSKTAKMRVSEYSVFSYLLRLVQRTWYEIFFNNDNSAEETNEDPSKQVVKRSLGYFGMRIQHLILQSETWFNSLLILLFFYSLFNYEKISWEVGLFLTTVLFIALTCVAIEYSLYSNGFHLIELFPKDSEPFRCRLMRLDEKMIRVLIKKERSGTEYNPIERYPIEEVSKIRNVSMGEMLDEF
ncbi:MAG: hypothetical protein R6U44_01550 [Archaeoglobaceae archaeon]